MNVHPQVGAMKRWTLGAPGRINLALGNAPVPSPAASQLVVKVSAVSLNYRDLLLIEDGLGLPTGGNPLVPGSDAAGVVVATGAAVTRFKVGERVISTFIPGWIDGPGLGNAREPNVHALGGPDQGMLTEYVVLDEDWAVRAPNSLSDTEASTLPCAGLTAWTALVERGKLHAGQTVVVQGTGGVAMLGLQIAAMHGAEVIVVSGDDAKLARAKALGARYGVNRHTEDWVEAVYRITGDRGADHVLEIVGGAHLGRSLQAAAVGGRVSLIGVLEGFDISGQFVPLAVKHLTIEGIQVGHRTSLEALVRAVDRTGIKPVIDAEYDLADLRAALDHLARGPFGKVVVRMGGVTVTP
jgi:NADPH:quinone reductase-like Zn-dependent oxidoreductase